jgi:3-phosphoshikimate 1-carboxyvinyltransferase
LDQSQRITVSPFNGNLNKEFTIPGSKSITNRAFMLAICSEGVSRIYNPLFSDDTQAGLEAARTLGCRVEQNDNYIEIEGISRSRPVSNATIDVRSAGTVARFLPCMLAMGDAGTWELNASAQMTQRPMKGLFEALAELGPCVETRGKPNHYPITVKGRQIESNEAFVDGSVSSQYLSGVLLGAPQFNSELTFRTDGKIVQRQYVDITLDCMRAFGAKVDATDNLSEIKVSPTGLTANNFYVEADASTATYYSALPAALGGSVTIDNLARNSFQPDIRFLEILTELGCHVEWAENGHVTISRPAELKKLKGGQSFNLNDCSDAALTVAALAPLADAPIEITGVAHIRNHECDRVDAMTVALTEMGITVEERQDGWKIFPGEANFAEVGTRDDHRMAMALTVLGLAADGVSLDYPNCVAKTNPDFFKSMESIRD